MEIRSRGDATRKLVGGESNDVCDVQMAKQVSMHRSLDSNC